MSSYLTQKSNFDYAFQLVQKTGEYDWEFSLTYDSIEETLWSEPLQVQNMTGKSGVSTCIDYVNGALFLGNPEEQNVEVYYSQIGQEGVTNGLLGGEFYKINRMIPYGLDTTSGYGSSLQGFNNSVFIGAPYSTVGNITGAGVVFTNESFLFGGTGATGTGGWGNQGYIQGSHQSGAFGCSLSRRILGDSPRAGIGATGENSGSGAFYLYGADNSSFIKKIDPTGVGVSNFAKSHAFSSVDNLGYLAISYEQNNRGKVNVYKESYIGADDYTIFQYLNEDESETYDLYGSTLQGGDSSFMIGAPNLGSSGRVYYYSFSESDGIYLLKQEITAPNLSANDHFGKSLSFSTGTTVIGSDQNSGSAYIFTNRNGNWDSQISGSSPTIDGAFAGESSGSRSVIVDFNRIIVGTKGESNTYLFATGLTDIDDYSGVSFSGSNNKIYDSDGNFLYGYSSNNIYTISGGVFTGGFYSIYINNNLCRSRSPRSAGVGRTGQLNDWAITGEEAFSSYSLEIIN